MNGFFQPRKRGTCRARSNGMVFGSDPVSSTSGHLQENFWAPHFFFSEIKAPNLNLG